MDPIEVQRTDDWRIPDEMLETMAADYQEVDYYLYNDGARCGDVMLEFSLRYPKPCTCLSDCRGSTLINASLLSHGVECYPVDGWEELRRVLTAARVRKMLRELRVLTTYRFNAVQSGISAPNSFNSLDKVTEVFGTRFRMINLHELMDMLHVIPCTEPHHPGPPQPEPDRGGYGGDRRHGRPADGRGEVRPGDPGGCDQHPEDVQGDPQEHGQRGLQRLCRPLRRRLLHPPAQ